MSQNISPTDLRVQRTRTALRDTLLELIVEKGFNAISVGELTERAMVNRATFYRHYRDKDDLLEQIIAAMLDELTRSGTPPTTHGSQTVPVDAVLDAWRRVLAHVADHATLYRAMMGPKGSPTFAMQVTTYVKSLLRQRSRAGNDGRGTKLPDEVGVAFTASAFLGTVAWWLEAGMPYTTEQMAVWLAALFVLGPYQAAGWEIARGIGGA